MSDDRSVLLPEMIDARLRDIIHTLALPAGTVVRWSALKRIPKADDEANWDCSCSFNPDPEGNFEREFERKKNALRAVFELPESSEAASTFPRRVPTEDRRDLPAGDVGDPDDAR